MEKKDARKRYTQMVLKQSLLKLLKEKPVNKITVKEVCELSQLNRATFYAHYSDCFALLESIENELIGAFEQSLRYVNSFDVTALIEAIYDMIDQNREVRVIAPALRIKLFIFQTRSVTSFLLSRAEPIRRKCICRALRRPCRRMYSCRSTGLCQAWSMYR